MQVSQGWGQRLGAGAKKIRWVGPEVRVGVVRAQGACRSPGMGPEVGAGEALGCGGNECTHVRIRYYTRVKMNVCVCVFVWGGGGEGDVWAL